MKKILAVIAITGLFAAAAQAAPSGPGATPGGGVLGSIHDMNVLGNVPGLGTIAPDAQGRVCAFCHTPHHALSNVAFEYAPLWSHQFTSLDAPNKYDGYASPTFDGGKPGAVDSLTGPSRLCMSCHDGIVAPDQHYNFGGNAPGGLMASDNFDGKAVGLGAKFSNDHPIGFDVTVLMATGSNVDAGIKDIAGAATWLGSGKAIKSFLYDASGVGSGPQYMTCATCHDVHNKDNVINDDLDAQHQDNVGGNYLVYAKQAGSQLCLSCHDK